MTTDALLTPGSDSPAAVDAALVMAARFGLGRLAAISQFESFGNENWLLEDSTGGRCVLRRYVHSSPERVAFQIRLQRSLRERGFPASAVLTAADGRFFIPDKEGVPWVAFEHIEGREYNFSQSDAVQAARSLAELHRLGAGTTEDAPPLPHRPSILECWANAGSDVAGLRVLFSDRGLDSELDYLEGWWSEVLAVWPFERFQALPRGLTHGDFHGRNTAYRDDRLAGIFDFDDVESGPFAYDLAWSMYKFGRESRFSPALRVGVARAFLQAYESVRPLSIEERSALPVLLATTYPPNPRYYRYYRDHHGTNIENRLRREAGLMRFLGDEIARAGPGAFD